MQTMFFLLFIRAMSMIPDPISSSDHASPPWQLGKAYDISKLSLWDMSYPGEAQNIMTYKSATKRIEPWYCVGGGTKPYPNGTDKYWCMEMAFNSMKYAYTAGNNEGHAGCSTQPWANPGCTCCTILTEYAQGWIPQRCYIANEATCPRHFHAQVNQFKTTAENFRFLKTYSNLDSNVGIGALAATIKSAFGVSNEAYLVHDTEGAMGTATMTQACHRIEPNCLFKGAYFNLEEQYYQGLMQFKSNVEAKKSWHCYHYQDNQDGAWCQAQQKAGNGYAYTKGNNANYPGCEGCWCCAETYKWTCYHYKDGQDNTWCQQQQKAGKGFALTWGNNANYPGCGWCSCCSKQGGLGMDLHGTKPYVLKKWTPFIQKWGTHYVTGVNNGASIKMVFTATGTVEMVTKCAQYKICNGLGVNNGTSAKAGGSVKGCSGYNKCNDSKSSSVTWNTHCMMVGGDQGAEACQNPAKPDPTAVSSFLNSGSKTGENSVIQLSLMPMNTLIKQMGQPADLAATYGNAIEYYLCMSLNPATTPKHGNPWIWDTTTGIGKCKCNRWCNQAGTVSRDPTSCVCKCKGNKKHGYKGINCNEEYGTCQPGEGTGNPTQANKVVNNGGYCASNFWHAQCSKAEICCLTDFNGAICPFGSKCHCSYNSCSCIQPKGRREVSDVSDYDIPMLVEQLLEPWREERGADSPEYGLPQSDDNALDSAFGPPAPSKNSTPKPPTPAPGPASDPTPPPVSTTVSTSDSSEPTPPPVSTTVSTTDSSDVPAPMAEPVPAPSKNTGPIIFTPEPTPETRKLWPSIQNMNPLKNPPVWGGGFVRSLHDDDDDDDDDEHFLEADERIGRGAEDETRTNDLMGRLNKLLENILERRG